MKTDTRGQIYVVRKAMLLLRQDGLCPCGGVLDGEVQIDHNHACCPQDRADRTCGLCDRAAVHPGCNTAISRVAESPERLRALADYLERVA